MRRIGHSWLVSWLSRIIRRKKRFCVCCIGLMTVLFLFLKAELNTQSWTSDPVDKRFVYTYPSREWSVTRTPKLILLWTGFFTSDIWDTDRNVFDLCSHRCLTTTNRTLLLQSDAVLFNTRELSEHFELPVQRVPHQVWILHNTEPPYYIYLDTDRLKNVFNWTSWYRKDATVFSSFGEWVPLTGGEKLAYTKKNYFQNKTKMAAWVSSNCNDKGGRKRLVDELGKYIDIDTYGKCGQLKCVKNCFHIFSQYKFFLSFENGFCRDYISEKFWRPIIREQIPVVRGGADYEHMVPPRSYVSSMHISAKSLADKLIQIGSNENQYNSYFEWKRDFKLETKGHEWTRVNWCRLCEQLYNTTLPAQVYTDLTGWIEQDVCFNDNKWFGLAKILQYIISFF